MGFEKTPKTFNARFEKNTFWQIADLLAARYGRDKTDVVSRAVREAHERMNGSGGPAPSTFIPPHVDQTAADAPFHPLCKHCGSTFGAFNRFASLCPECKGLRHVGDPRDCPVCTAGSAI